MTKSLSYWAFGEVSTNLKCKFTYLKRGFFILNSKRALNFYGFFAFLQKAQNDNALVILSNSEVSTNSKCDFSALKAWICTFKAWIFHLKFKAYLKFFGFFAFCESSKWQECAVIVKWTKSVFFVCHYERTKRAWQSTNLNANLPLDCHEFARLRFANSRNDTTPKPPQKFFCLSYWA